MTSTSRRSSTKRRRSPSVRQSALGVDHFELHHLEISHVPTGVEAQKLEVNKKLDKLTLHPQIDATEETKFVSATDANRASILVTKVVEKRYATEDIVDEVRSRLLGHDARTGGTLSKDYSRETVETMIVDALKHLGLDGKEVSQENRQVILNSFGGLRQRSVVPKARLAAKPTGLRVLSTADMRPINDRISKLTDNLALYWDEYSDELGTEEDAVALRKARELHEGQPIALYEVVNSYDFQSPVNVVLADHAPERGFVQRLVHPKNAAVLRSWVKAPDTGFYEIEYAYQEAGVGRSKRGKFNPDFFLYLTNSDLVVVVEVKMDSDDTWKNKGKAIAAGSQFKRVNELLEAEGSERRYSFHFLTPKDYDRFFETLREGKLDSFISTLQGQLDAKK